MIQFERPLLLFCILLLFPALLFFSLYAKKFFQNLLFIEQKNLPGKSRVKVKIVLRSVLFSLAWICFVFALSGPSWGMKAEAVQKSGVALSFVFDISHSMEALDSRMGTGSLGEEKSRLSHASDWATALLSKITGKNQNPNVSVVITKGESFVSLPFSQDYHSFYSYVSILNPYLMTAPGSHLGSGIRSATRSFPANHARFASIILLTDGDDTRGDLEESISEALSYGINVLIVGFGSLEGTEVLSGGSRQRQGEGTEVYTSLKEASLNEIVSRLKAKYPLHSNSVHYFPARDASSLEKLASIVNPKRDSGDKMLTSYTVKPIQRHLECLFFSLVFFIFALVFSQWNFKKQEKALSILSLFILFPLFFTSCSFPMKDAALLLEGAFYTNQDAYDKATFSFIKALERADQDENDFLKQYALYNLSYTYMKQNEHESAQKRLKQIDVDAPDQLLFARAYNQGIIAYEKGEFSEAFSYFKAALLVQPKNRDAKINLELALQQRAEVKPLGASSLSELTESNEPSEAHKSVFTLIRENEENHWKNRVVSNGDEDVLDY